MRSPADSLRRLWPTRPAAGPGRRVDLDGVSLHAVERAGGDDTSNPTAPLVLLHGYLAAAHVWEPLTRRLAGWRTIAMDLPGCGFSSRPPDAPYTPEWLAEVVLEAIAALGLERPILVGHSLGGAVALHAAARAPDQLSGLLLFSPLAFPTPLPDILRPAAHLPGPFQLFFRTVGRPTIRPALRRNYARLPPAEADAAIDLTIAHLDAPGGWRAATQMGLAAAYRAPLDDAIRGADLPTLLLWGSLDRVHPVALGRRLVSALPRADLVEMDSVGHNAHMERPDLSAAAIERWAAGLPNR